MLDLPLLQKLWPNGDQHVPGLLEGIAAAAPVVFPKYGLTPIAIAHFMAQCSEECGAGLEMVENDNFTAAQLERLWPTHFTGTMATRYAGNAKMICDIAYGGRMGNAAPPSDDGYNYRGKGLTNCTGKDGYAEVAKKTGIDVIAHPEYFSDPRYALELGVADFVLCGCLPYALKDDVVAVSAMLNVGHYPCASSLINGLSSREQWLAKWKAQLPALSAPAASAAPSAAATGAATPAPSIVPAAPASAASDNDDILRTLDELLTAIRAKLAA
jgi:putative chitinase